MKNLLLCFCLLLTAACRIPPNDTELDVIGTTIEYSFEPATKDVLYQVQFTSQIGSQISERIQPGQSFSKKINTNQTMGFKNADLVVQNLDGQKIMTGIISFKRSGRDRKTETITVAPQGAYKFTEVVYR
ncbi:hypothetical protein [Mucilaginibacter myungsuensis]|uniref:Uncharacterized protein n=1 Tax=Mucilaginibacter myungsuensis TaxID=649104 RepID=A0A929PWZ3_9SPHI|nr:hypothetical protein [Mucilaginibacter myungsuensis]MBE9662644.1 hypothetical protein [Mucilaginibacter myungsuensis]MDN3598064.1 hypothetical protein [Mucilaginibacter myungsuensis]